MRLQQRRVVVDFESRRQTLLAQRGLMQRVDATDDKKINAAWDDLLRLVIQAWSWRDRQCLDALETAVVAVRKLIEDDWPS